MRTLFFITGATATGKTHLAHYYASEYGGGVIETDKLCDWLESQGVYGGDIQELTRPRTLFANVDEKFIRQYFKRVLEITPHLVLWIEGALCASERFRNLVCDLIVGQKQRALIVLESEEYEARHYEKHDKGADMALYRSFYNGVQDEKHTFRFKNLDFAKSPLIYQKEDFAKAKWEGLQVPQKKGLLIDLGCNEGRFGRYWEGEYIGIDNQFKEVAKATQRNNDVIKFGDIPGLLPICPKADIIVCASVLHYFDNKERIIRLASKKCNLLILEMPISQNTELEEYTVEGKDYKIPTKELVLSWLGKYFSTVEVKGQSVSPNNDFRLVFHARK